MKESEKQFVVNIVRQLDQSIACLDLPIQSRLDHLRQQAIDSARTRVDTKPTDQGPALLHSIENRLEADNEAVPTEVETRLNEIRRQAMAKAAQLQQGRESDRLKASRRYWSGLIASLRSASGTAIASACMLVLAVSLLFVIPETSDEVSISEEINLLASADELELYENLDFYMWLAENDISN